LPSRNAIEGVHQGGVVAEFLLQIDGVFADPEKQNKGLYLIGATNMPQTIDEAVRR